jgi:TrmH family RNA methyltransferase
VNSIIGKWNPWLTEVRKSLRAGALMAGGLLPIEGPHLLDEALASGVEIHEVLLDQNRKSPDGVPASRIRHVAHSTFRTLGRTRESQGVITLVRPPEPCLDEIFRRATAGDGAPRRGGPAYGPIVLLCGLQDPGNAGTIFRSAEAFGAAGVVATPGTVTCYNDKLLRASAGSFLRLPRAWDVDLTAFVRQAGERGIRILAASPRGSVRVDEVDFGRPTAVMIGREGAGLDPTELDAADELVRIPLRPPVESLNAASAALVFLYAASREWENAR